MATVNLHTTSIKGSESPYPLHPASLDDAIQLGLIVCHGGRPGEASTAFVPIQLSRLYLLNNIDTIAGDTCTVVGYGERRGVRGANLELQMLGSNGEVLLNLDILRSISYPSTAKPVDRTFSSPFTSCLEARHSYAKQSPSAPDLPSSQGERGEVSLMGHHDWASPLRGP